MGEPTIDDIHNMAEMFRQGGYHIQAATLYLGLARDLPDSNYYMFYGASLLDAGHLDEGIKALREYTEIFPDRIDGWTTLGRTLLDLNRFEDAIEPLKRARAIKDKTKVNNMLIMALESAGRSEEAQILGLHNLKLKDRVATKRFPTKPFATAKLTNIKKKFDPEDPSKNIISFSLWGKNPKYVTGAIINAQLTPYIYPQWTSRFYCDSTVPFDARAALQHLGAQVVMMDTDSKKYRNMWRFFVSDDPNVNVFICRDADSRLNIREAAAVQEWLQTEKRFHVMRDHIWHMELILAGMWGGVAGVLPNLKNLLNKLPDYFEDKFADQAFLMDLVWPLIKEDMKLHDTFYGNGDSSQFPKFCGLPGKNHVGTCIQATPHWRSYLDYSKILEADEAVRSNTEMTKAAS